MGEPEDSYNRGLNVGLAAAKKTQLEQRRERIATAVLAGFALQRLDGNTAVLIAVAWANALIAELDKK